MSAQPQTFDLDDLEPLLDLVADQLVREYLDEQPAAGNESAGNTGHDRNED